jgi:hypothetical protein
MMTSEPSLEVVPDLLRTLVKLAADAKSLAAAMHKAADAAAVIDPATFTFCHRLKMVLVDMSHQLSTLELPANLRDAR